MIDVESQSQLANLSWQIVENRVVYDGKRLPIYFYLFIFLSFRL